MRSEIPYSASIGLEVHVQLRTRSKMFCRCRVETGAEPNAHTCPICLGFPGALPAMNHEALRLTVLTGQMLDCDISPISRFDRKNYFYPDMPKNYQISQYELPLCRNGRVKLHRFAFPTDAQKNIADPDKEVRLVRIHLEEDVGKSQHFETSTGVDFNRAGTPLMEIVTQPDMNSAEETFAFLTSLKQQLIYGGVSDADMEKGQLRCDCNVSVRAAKKDELGEKVEIKNMNSFSAIRRALQFEIERQSAARERGEAVNQETRGWDEKTGRTYLMRTKESAHDYRYFPDPDLPLIRTDSLVAEIRNRLPESPAEKRSRFVSEFGATPYDAAVLSDDPAVARYFETGAKESATAKLLANWVINDLRSALNASGKSIDDCPVPPAALNQLVAMVERGQISGNQARAVFAEMFASGRSAGEIVKEKGIEQLSDDGAIADLCDAVIGSNPKPVADFKSGNEASLNFLAGQVMKGSKGKANPRKVTEVLRDKLR